MIKVEKEPGYSDKQEILNKWLETGQSDNGVAVYGTSAEIVAQIINTGAIEPYKGPLFEQDKPFVNGRNLYYCLPLNSLDELINDRQQIDKAIGYAISRTLGDDIGVPDTEVIMVAQRRLKNVEKYFDRDGIYDAINHTDWYSSQQINVMVRKLRRRFGEDLDPRLKRALKRKGVLLFYNEGFLDHEVSFGREDSDELMVVTDQPLDLQVIEGIKPLTKLDEKILRDLI